jgi:hypothetical protein
MMQLPTGTLLHTGTTMELSGLMRVNYRHILPL